jgi:site-specific recombinase XerD
MTATPGAGLQFDQYLTTCNLAAGTRTQYDRQALRWERWCWANKVDPMAPDPLQVAAYADTIPETHASRKAVQSALAHYFRWAGRDDQPEQAMRVPRKPRRRARPLTRDELGRLKEAALLVGGRQGLATLIGMYTNARRTEIAWMETAALDAGHVRWQRAKTGDITILPAHPVLEDAWRHYLRDHTGGMYLFPGDRGRPHVSPTTIWEWVRGVGRTCGVTLAPHQLRHSWATYALQATKDARAVQEAMAHRDLGTTAGYTEVSEEQLEELVASIDW